LCVFVSLEQGFHSLPCCNTIVPTEALKGQTKPVPASAFCIFCRHAVKERVRRGVFSWLQSTTLPLDVATSYTRKAITHSCVRYGKCVHWLSEMYVAISRKSLKNCTIATFFLSAVFNCDTPPIVLLVIVPVLSQCDMLTLVK